MSAAEEKKKHNICTCWLSMGKMSVTTVSSLTGESVNTPAFSTDGALGRFALGKPLFSVFVVVREVDGGGCERMVFN